MLDAPAQDAQTAKLGRPGRTERRVTLALTIGPFIALLIAIPLLWSRGITALDLGLFIVTYLIAGLGITVGYHRYFTHKGFTAGPKLRLVMGLAGSMAIEGSLIAWVADHRRHHAYSDREGDPHSPHLEDTVGVWGVIRGLWHAHIGWLFKKEPVSAARWAPDLVKDPAMRFVDRAFPVCIVISLAGPALIGLIVTRSWMGALTAFLWGGLVRSFFVHHVTWSINSICHFYGKRPYETKDQSTNNWLLSLPSLGESWHNNHHAFPSAAVHGINRGQVDVSGLVILGMERIGLVSDVKRANPKKAVANKDA